LEPWFSNLCGPGVAQSGLASYVRKGRINANKRSAGDGAPHHPWPPVL
jgi:hypothetical protein